MIYEHWVSKTVVFTVVYEHGAAWQPRRMGPSPEGLPLPFSAGWQPCQMGSFLEGVTPAIQRRMTTPPDGILPGGGHPCHPAPDGNPAGWDPPLKGNRSHPAPDGNPD